MCVHHRHSCASWAGYMCFHHRHSCVSWAGYMCFHHRHTCTCVRHRHTLYMSIAGMCPSSAHITWSVAGAHVHPSPAHSPSRLFLVSTEDCSSDHIPTHNEGISKLVSLLGCLHRGRRTPKEDCVKRNVVLRHCEMEAISTHAHTHTHTQTYIHTCTLLSQCLRKEKACDDKASN